MNKEEVIEAYKTIERTLEYNCDKELTILYNLVKKATPEKPYFLNYGGHKIGNWKCPSCDLIITKDNYCKCCGQALDWSDEDDKYGGRRW